MFPGAPTTNQLTLQSGRLMWGKANLSSLIISRHNPVIQTRNISRICLLIAWRHLTLITEDPLLLLFPDLDLTFPNLNWPTPISHLLAKNLDHSSRFNSSKVGASLFSFRNVPPASIHEFVVLKVGRENKDHFQYTQILINIYYTIWGWEGDVMLRW